MKTEIETLSNGLNYFTRGGKKYWYIEGVDSQRDTETFIVEPLTPFKMEDEEVKIIIKSRTAHGEKTEPDEQMQWMLRGEYFSQFLKPLSRYLYRKKTGHRYLKVINTRVNGGKKVDINMISFTKKNTLKSPFEYPLKDVYDMRYIDYTDSGNFEIRKGEKRFGTLPEIKTAMCVRDVIEKLGFPSVFFSTKKKGGNPRLKELQKKCFELPAEKAYEWVIHEYPELASKEDLEQQKECDVQETLFDDEIVIEKNNERTYTQSELDAIVKQAANQAAKQAVAEVFKNGNL